VSLALAARGAVDAGVSAERPAAGPGMYLSFQLDGHSYAVPLALVVEITPFRELSRLPHMPKSVEGLLDHRGQVFPVINLRSRMKLGKQAASLSRNIVLLDLGGASPVGILVDVVESVLSAAPDQLVAASPLLAGPEGAWVRGFILRQGSLVVVLDPGFITATQGARAQLHGLAAQDQGLALNEGLQELIAMAPPRTAEDATRIIPQMEEATNHTEQEMAKVLDCVESMLGHNDQAFQAMVRLKQEAALGRLKGEDATLAQLEKVGTELQDQVFNLILQLQFQDIARQKLERVLNHIRGIQVAVGSKFRDLGKRQP